MEHKCCPLCKTIKPATKEYFPGSVNRKYGIGDYCKICHNKRGKDWAKSHPEYIKEKDRKWQKQFRKKFPERYKEKQRKCEQKLKIEMIEAYGGKCSCCGESMIEFLTIEHIKKNGKEHREKVGEGSAIWRDLKRNGYPKDGYTIYCWNCNMATSRGRICPHKKVGTRDGT